MRHESNYPMNWRRAILIFTVLILVDRAFTSAANYFILMRDADFTENHRDIDVNWEGPPIQGCTRSAEFLIYTYQTCFDVRSFSDLEESVAIYRYSKPRPKLALSRLLISSSYYFTEVALGRTLFYVHYGGEIEGNK